MVAGPAPTWDRAHPTPGRFGCGSGTHDRREVLGHSSRRAWRVIREIEEVAQIRHEHDVVTLLGRRSLEFSGKGTDNAHTFERAMHS